MSLQAARHWARSLILIHFWEHSIPKVNQFCLVAIIGAWGFLNLQ